MCIAATVDRVKFKVVQKPVPVVHNWPICDHCREGVQSTDLVLEDLYISRLLRNSIFILTRHSCISLFRM